MYCTIPYYTIQNVSRNCSNIKDGDTQVHGAEDWHHNSAVEHGLHSGQGVEEGGSRGGHAGVGAGARKGC